MVRPSGTWGTGSTRVRAGRPLDDGPRARAVIWPPLRLARRSRRDRPPRARIRGCRVARQLPGITTASGGGSMRVVGLDIHRVFAEAVMLDDGRAARLGRVGMTRGHLEAF